MTQQAATPASSSRSKRKRKYDPVKNREYQQRYRSKLPPEKLDEFRDKVRTALRNRRDVTKNPLIALKHRDANAKYCAEYEKVRQSQRRSWYRYYCLSRADILPIDEQLILEEADETF